MAFTIILLTATLLHTINDSLPIEISLKKRSVKSIWSCVNNENYISVSNKIATFCFWPELHIFSYKYSILPHQWYESYSWVHYSIMDYISQNCTDHNYGIMIRDLCFDRDSCDIPTATNIVKLIEYLCTIKNICSNVHFISINIIMHCIDVSVR